MVWEARWIEDDKEETERSEERMDGWEVRYLLTFENDGKPVADLRTMYQNRSATRDFVTRSTLATHTAVTTRT